MRDPYKGPKGDPSDLQIANVVECRLTISGEDVEHVANKNARLSVHSWAPEAE